MPLPFLLLSPVKVFEISTKLEKLFNSFFSLDASKKSPDQSLCALPINEELYNPVSKVRVSRPSIVFTTPTGPLPYWTAGD